MNETLSQFVPTAFEPYQDCPDCDVTVHGPREPGSPGGCHVDLCDTHAEAGL